MTTYKQDLLTDLASDPEYAAMYVNDALSASPEEFLMALRDIAEAKNFTKVSESANLNRVSMYRMLSSSGNPRLSSLTSLLTTLGLKLSIGLIENKNETNENSSPASAGLLPKNQTKQSGSIAMSSDALKKGPSRALGNASASGYFEASSSQTTLRSATQ